jgi:hypothetical protein
LWLTTSVVEQCADVVVVAFLNAQVTMIYSSVRIHAQYHARFVVVQGIAVVWMVENNVHGRRRYRSSHSYQFFFGHHLIDYQPSFFLFLLFLYLSFNTQYYGRKTD